MANAGGTAEGMPFVPIDGMIGVIKKKEKNAKKIAKVKNYVEEIIGAQIDQAAYEGKEMLSHYVDIQKTTVYEVMEELVANGYEVKLGVKYPNIKIYW